MIEKLLDESAFLFTVGLLIVGVIFMLTSFAVAILWALGQED